MNPVEWVGLALASFSSTCCRSRSDLGGRASAYVRLRSSMLYNIVVCYVALQYIILLCDIWCNIKLLQIIHWRLSVMF